MDDRAWLYDHWELLECGHYGHGLADRDGDENYDVEGQRALNCRTCVDTARNNKVFLHVVLARVVKSIT